MSFDKTESQLSEIQLLKNENLALINCLCKIQNTIDQYNSIVKRSSSIVLSIEMSEMIDFFEKRLLKNDSLYCINEPQE